MTKPKLRFKDKNGNAYPEWSQEKIGNLTKIYDGTHQTPKYTDKGIKFLSVENISDIQASNKFISEEAYNTEFKVKPEVNDILMTRIGDIGTPALINTNEQYAYYVSLALIKCSRQLLPKWLVQAILSNSFQKQLYKRTLHVAFPKKINKGEIGECIVNYPCLEEQEKIAGFLSKVDELINECEGEVKDLEEQKKGLMQKIFSQQIRFKDSNNPYPDWEEKYVNEVCDISTGKGNTQDKEDNGIYPFYVRSPIIERSNKYIFDGEAVLTVGDGVGTGKVYHYVKGKFNFHQRVYKMSNFNGILGKYFYYYFSTHFYDRVKKMTAKTSVDSVRLEMISKMTILIPCQEEQEKIAKVLSKMDELIEEKKALLSDWQQFKKGLLQQMFV